MSWLPLGKKRGNLDEFEGLIETHLDGLYRVAMRYTRDRSLAEDLVHDTVVRALRFRDKFEPGTNFKAWSYTILTHTFIHKYRRQKREREVLDGHTREDVERQLSSQEARDAAFKPEDVYLERMLSDEVIAALDALPEEFRAVITLCDLEGLSYKEIADAIGSPVGTVMSRLYRGRRLLESKLYRVAVERGIVKRDAEASPGEAVVDMSVFLRRRKDG
jgi:RNA polymerase sigma-70 factor (ECF subfamily)